MAEAQVEGREEEEEEECPKCPPKVLLHGWLHLQTWLPY